MFVQVNVGLPDVYNGTIAWCDYDNDGRLDFLITGIAGPSAISQVWRNTGNGLTNVTSVLAPDLPGVYYSSVAWGDYDNDGRLDFLLTGASGSTLISKLRRNDTPQTNKPPTAPAGLTASFSNAIATLSWNAGSDAHTPTAGLTYNLRIGTTPGGSDVLAPMSDTSGWRLLPAMGNRQKAFTFPLQSPTLAQPYYWSAQPWIPRSPAHLLRQKAASKSCNRRHF